MMLFLASARRDGEGSRARILAAVARDPGIHVSELAQCTGLSWHTTAYHLQILEQSRRLKVEKGERERRVFPADLPQEQRAWLAALRIGQASRVLRLLLENPGQSIPGLSRRMGYSEKVVRRQIANLADAGLVKRQGQMRPTYEPDTHAREVAVWLRLRQGRLGNDLKYGWETDQTERQDPGDALE